MSDIKMSDKFPLPLSPTGLFHTLWAIQCREKNEYISHAINNHDRLVEENTKMKETISYLEAENKKAVDFIYELGDKLGESASKMRRGF